MPKKSWKYVRLTANVLGKGAAGQHLVIGEEVSREMAEGWVSREIAVFTDEEAAQESRSPGVEESRAPEQIADERLALEDASLEEVLTRAETLLEGKPLLARAISLVRKDMTAEHISMAEMARRVEVDVKEIQAAVDDGRLTRYDVDGGKKMLKASEAISAWQSMQADNGKSLAEAEESAAEETRAPIEVNQGELDIDPALRPED